MLLTTLAAGSLAQTPLEVQLSAEQRSALGIETVELTSVSVPRSYLAAAQVIDAAPLIALLTELHAAKLAAAASQSELQRAQALHADDSNVAQKSVDSARAQAASDAAHVAALTAQLKSAWGAGLAAPTEDERLLKGLQDGTVVLVRAETLAAVPRTVHLKQAHVTTFSGTDRWSAAVIGRIAQATDHPMGAAYMLRVEASGLQAGEALEATLEDDSEELTGVQVPRSAVLRSDGAEWVFVAEGSEFKRQRIRPVLWTDAGCLVQKNLRAGQQVVVTGAALLLSAGTTNQDSEAADRD